MNLRPGLMTGMQDPYACLPISTCQILIWSDNSCHGLRASVLTTVEMQRSSHQIACPHVEVRVSNEGKKALKPRYFYSRYYPKGAGIRGKDLVMASPCLFSEHWFSSAAMTGICFGLLWRHIHDDITCTRGAEKQLLSNACHTPSPASQPASQPAS